RAVRRELHPRADLAQLASLLVHIDVDAMLEERRGGREAADAAADDQNAHGRQLYLSRMRLTLACGRYDRTQALIDGRVKIEGVTELNYLALRPGETFWRMLNHE